MLALAHVDPHDGHAVTHHHRRHPISDNVRPEHDADAPDFYASADYDWAYDYAEAVARHFDDPAPLLLAHAAGLDIHALALDSRADRCRELAGIFRGFATPPEERAEYDRRTT